MNDRLPANRTTLLHIGILLCGAAALLVSPRAFAQEHAVNAAGAVLMDQATTRVLASKNAHTRLLMASTTKVMTALLALENERLDTLISVPAAAVGVEGSSMYLELGEELTLQDLLYGLMLSSGNDAAITIAVHIGGSVEGFAQLMNSRAKHIGCQNTNFVTPNGLHDENHYTTAYDLALICAAAMNTPSFRMIVSTQYWETTSGNITRTLKNKNKILWQYEGGNGIKTGYTKAAGRCLTFSAEREGNTLIGVVLGCPDMWNEAANLLNMGYREYVWEEIVSAGTCVRQAAVEKGMKDVLEIVAKEDILIPLRHGETADDLTVRLQYDQTPLAPVYAGQVVGRMEVTLGSRVLASTPLLAGETVERKEYPYYLMRAVRSWLGDVSGYTR